MHGGPAGANPACSPQGIGHVHAPIRARKPCVRACARKRQQRHPAAACRRVACLAINHGSKGCHKGARRQGGGGVGLGSQLLLLPGCDRAHAQAGGLVGGSQQDGPNAPASSRQWHRMRHAGCPRRGCCCSTSGTHMESAHTVTDSSSVPVGRVMWLSVTAAAGPARPSSCTFRPASPAHRTTVDQESGWHQPTPALQEHSREALREALTCAPSVVGLQADHTLAALRHVAVDLCQAASRGVQWQALLCTRAASAQALQVGRAPGAADATTGMHGDAHCLPPWRRQQRAAAMQPARQPHLPSTGWWKSCPAAWTAASARPCRWCMRLQIAGGPDGCMLLRTATRPAAQLTQHIRSVTFLNK